MTNLPHKRLTEKLLNKIAIYGLGTAGVCTALVGCSGGPAPVALPDFDPSSASTKAIEVYDLNRDGFVADEELEKAPSLKAALKNLDTNNDQKVSAEEIANRVKIWQSSKIGLMSFSCDVSLDGIPLDEGIITYEPEEFLGDVIQEAVGEIKYGSATPIVPKDKRPSPDSLPGIQAGLYKVKISRLVNGKEVIPSKYNTNTILGHEVSRDDPGILNKSVRYTLKSK